MAEEKKMKILVADDSEYERTLFRKILEQDYDVVEAENGETALVHLTMFKEEIVLVILDLYMPQMDGFAVLEMLNQMGWIEEIPIIMISSEENLDIVQKAYDLGVTDFINKAVSRTVINKRVKNTIHLFARQRQNLMMMLQENTKLQNVDALTGALNLNGFRQKAKETLMKNPDCSFAISYIDIRGFKFINDLYGIETGNQLLKYLVTLFFEAMDDDELIGRETADRFITLTKIYDKKEDERFADIFSKLSHCLDRPGRSFAIEFAAGTYIVMQKDYHDPDMDSLISHALVAHEKARKKRGTVHAFFNDDEWRKQWRAIQICQQLEASIKNEEISVWLQPQYSFESNCIIAAEALCRWVHPELGFISPGEFVPVLEESGQIYQLDQYIWEKVCSLQRDWRGFRFAQNFAISVNISRADLHDEFTPDECLYGLIQKYDIPANCINVEITEGAYVEDTAHIIDLVNRFHEKGFLVEMDDFGSGYSSLNSLKNIDVDVLKLDMGFLQDAEHSVRGEQILDGVIQMAKTMDIALVAEGIETVHQAEMLKGLGCDVMQGYYFSKPLPIEQFVELLNNDYKQRVREGKSQGPTAIFDLFERMNRRNAAQKEPINYEKAGTGAATGGKVEDNIPALNRDNLTDAEWMNLLSEKRYLNQMPAGFFCYEADFEQKFVYISQGALELLGYPDEASFRAKFNNSFINMVYEKDRERVFREIDVQLLETGYQDYCEYRVETYDGALKWVYDSGRLVVGDGGKRVFYVVISDIDYEMGIRDNEHRNNEKYKILTRIGGFNIFDYSIADDVLEAEVSFENGFRISPVIKDFMSSMEKDGLVDEESAEKMRNLLKEAKQGAIASGSFRAVCRFVGDMFHTYRCHFSCLTDRNGNAERIVGYATNIEHEEKDIVRWKDKALKDSMTNLLNHEASLDAIDAVLSENYYGTAVILDVDDFKGINDEFGHLFGDSILTQVAETLRDSLRSNDIIGRYGGDEFVFFMERMLDSELAERKLQELLKRFHRIELQDGRPVKVSMGAVVYTRGDLDATQLLKRADVQLYNSKQDGKDRIYIEKI